MMEQFFLAVMANKARIGTVMVVLGGMFWSGVQLDIFHGAFFTVSGFVMGYLGAALIGGGVMKSDSFFKPQSQAVNIAAKDAAVVAAVEAKGPPSAEGADAKAP